MDESKLKHLHPSSILDLESNHQKFVPGSIGSFITPIKYVSKDVSFSRAYIPGDPINMIDWKSYSKTDQLIVREKNEVARAHILIVMDISETMFWPDENIKMELAFRIATHLAAAHFKMGDYITLSIHHKLNHFYLKPSSLIEIISLFEENKKIKFESNFLKSFFKADHFHQNKLDRIYLISDFLSEDILKLDESSRSLTCIQTLSSLEVDLNWLQNQSVYYFDSSKELSGKILKTPGLIEAEIKKWQNRLKKWIKSKDGVFITFTEESFMSDYLYFLENLKIMDNKDYKK